MMTFRQGIILIGGAVFTVICLIVAISYVTEHAREGRLKCVVEAQKAQLSEIATLAVCNIPETRGSITIKQAP